MLSVEEAQKLIIENTPVPRPVEAMLRDQPVGLVLAEDVVSDMDMPPFDKAVMDGYAVRSADFAASPTTLEVIEEVTAGKSPNKQVGAGQAARIMTGAPMSAGADAVVVVERSKMLDDRRVSLEGPVRPGQNFAPRGQEMRTGDVVLKAGAKLRAPEFGLLAAVGRTAAWVCPAPTVAILPTGDEIVEPPDTPGPGQIRNSNGPMLLAQVTSAGGVPGLVGIARDNLESLRDLIGRGLQEDVLVLSGGVSAGKLDLVPQVLAELGVDILMHKVQMKPGKPMLFGLKKQERRTTLVFGLPGNPVSSLVCFELFVRPALRRLAGHVVTGPSWLQATLEEDYPYRSDRPTYHPARVVLGEGGMQFRAVPWLGSADLRALTLANALVLLPAGDHHHRAGQVFPVMRIPD